MTLVMLLFKGKKRIWGCVLFWMLVGLFQALEGELGVLLIWGKCIRCVTYPGFEEEEEQPVEKGR